MTWRFDWITNWDEVWSDEFIAKWYKWMKNSPTAHVFFHPVLVRTWVETYLRLRRIEPRFLIATRDKCTVFFPLVLWQKNWKNAFQRVLVSVGDSDYDYHDPVIVGQKDNLSWSDFWFEFRQEVMNELPARYDMVQLTGIRESVASGDSFVREGNICPWCDLAKFTHEEAFLKSLNRSLRSDLRRRQRRMSEIGEIEYKVFSTEEASEAVDMLVEFLKVHTEKWPKAYKAPGFHYNLVKSGLPGGVIHFSLLKIGGDIAAWHLGFVDDRRFYYYMPAHKPEYAKLSPGKILLYYCIRDSIRKRLSVFDYLRGDESYKAEWTNRVERLYTLQFQSKSFMSRLCNFSAGHVKPVLSQIFRY